MDALERILNEAQYETEVRGASRNTIPVNFPPGTPNPPRDLRNINTNPRLL